MNSILKEIVDKRIENIKETGHSQGFDLPVKREVPLIPFGQEPFIIAEIKKKSPSKGVLNSSMDPVEQASKYFNSGIRNVSVLTEQNYFSGSLKDLIEVKKKFPELAVLRKDFLLDETDIELSYRAGADAVLLIASILEKEEIEAMYKKAKSLGMRPLVEVHDIEDIKKVAELKPELTGINSRDLKTFNIDMMIPVKLKNEIKWETDLVFESGIHSYNDAEFAFSSGFSAVLVGESLVKNPGLVSEFVSAKNNARKNNFWNRLYANNTKRPLVKICGLKKHEDILYCDKKGSDILGFILAESPRKIDISALKNLPETKALKAAVVIGKDLDTDYIKKLQDLVDSAVIDAVQIHHKGKIENIDLAGIDYYNALSIKSAKDFEFFNESKSQRTLIDAFQEGKYGGTGKVLDEDVLVEASKLGALWLAGGLSPFNIKEIIKKHGPELIDASSSLESAPGEKDHDLLDKYFLEINNAEVQ